MISKSKSCRFTSYKRDEDRISQLPEPIMHQILSLLSGKDATKTCVLSKTWNSTWNSVPVLDFNQQSFQEAAEKKKTKISPMKIAKDFSDYVSNSIDRRSSDTSVQKFNLIVYSTSFTLRYLNVQKWLNYAIRNNAQHLALHYSVSPCRYPANDLNKKNSHCVLPMESLSRAKSVKELDLFGCEFESSHVGFDFSLRKLHLENVIISQQTLQSLLSSCCFIEDFSMRNCTGFESVKVASVKLKTVDLNLTGREVQTVVIEAPNLQCISYAGDLGNIKNSVAASNYNKNLKELIFYDTSIRDEFFQEIICEFLQFQKLELRCCCLLETIRIPSNQLSELSISECIWLKEIKFGTRCLNNFKHEGMEVLHGPLKVKAGYNLRLELVSSPKKRKRGSVPGCWRNSLVKS